MESQKCVAERLILNAWICFELSRFVERVAPQTVLAASKNERVDFPLVVNTWGFTNATESARATLTRGGSALDAVVAGGTRCEVEQCDFTVGYGGSPDENGETTLDAMVMDGSTMKVGAVGALRGVKNAIGVARAVLERTRHSLLVGSQATEFAVQLGFPVEDLHTPASIAVWQRWQRKDHCQPNYWKNVEPDPKTSCGPYRRNGWWEEEMTGLSEAESAALSTATDTIGILVIDERGHVVSGTSTNGASHKIPGRVGDSPVPGSGSYADDEVGGAVATGDGDVMMRFLPTYQAVENMRRGMTPRDAADDAMQRIVRRHAGFEGAIVAANIAGELGAVCHGFKSFPYSMWSPAVGKVVVKYVNCH